MYSVAAAGSSYFKASGAQAIVESWQELIPHVVLLSDHSSKPVVPVLFADGSYAGPDSAGALGDLLFQYRLYNGIVRALEAGQSDSAAFLEAYAAATLSGSVRLHFRRRLAETLLQEKEFQGVEAAVLLARRGLAGLPRLHFTSGL